MARKYHRIVLGNKSQFFEECYQGNFIGVDYEIAEDLTGKFPDNWRDFTKKYIPIYLKSHPEKSKIAAGLACGTLWTVCYDYSESDLILVHNGQGIYHICKVTGPYYYVPGGNIPHRRPVQWLETAISREDMSDSLKSAVGARGTTINITMYAGEIEELVESTQPRDIIATDSTIEDVYQFALEKHLEDFLVKNWKHTELGKTFDIVSDEEGVIGQQYRTDTGPIDILAISKDKKVLLVIELKKGRGSDTVLGQIQRYMGYVQEELATDGQKVRGVIIAQEEDNRLRRALIVAPNIDFYRYEVTFKLKK